MDIGVLGMLSITTNHGTSQAFLARKPRTVLASLVVNAGQIVSISALTRELWGDTPPASAIRIVQTYVLAARKALSEITGVPVKNLLNSALTTYSGGYMFHRDFAHLDFAAFHNLAISGRQSARDGDYRSSIAQFDQALDLWRGPVLADVVKGPILSARQQQYEEARLSIIENLAEMKIEADRSFEVIADLAALTVEHPHHEGFHLQYMRALERSGRRAEALEVFHRLRTNLVSEFGIEPGISIQRLQHSILNSS
jgi:SARP family transcriptional regulator, regulator of embCAB operon